VVRQGLSKKLMPPGIQAPASLVLVNPDTTVRTGHDLGSLAARFKPSLSHSAIMFSCAAGDEGHE